MTKNIISLILLIVSAGLSFKHGWDTFNYKGNPGAVKAMADLGITEPAIPFLGVLALATGLLLLFPKTFVYGNIMSAVSIIIIMVLASRLGNFKMVLMEIPFLAMPLLLIYLGYPFKK